MKKNDELISVIIPTYNRSTTLERAINSVVNQTYKNIEIIIVDDNANNINCRKETEKIVKKYSNRYNLKLIENSCNLGGGLTRNEGIKASAGNLVAFLDDDDEFLPNKLELQYKTFVENQKNNVCMVYCYANMIKTNGTKDINKTDFEGKPISQNIRCCIAATSYWLCSKEALIKVGMFENISSRQDASLITKLLLNGYNVYRTPEILLNYYWHNGNGISKINENSLVAEKQWMDIFEKNAKYLSRKEKNNIYYIFYSRLCHLCLLLKKRKEACLYLKKMLKIKKFSFKNLQMIFGVLFNNLYVFIAKKRDIKRKQK